jgi:hypothetical protein
MRKLFVATAMYHFDYYHSFFIDYYVNAGATKVLIFCAPEDEKVILKSIGENDNNKYVVVLPIITLPYSNDPNEKINFNTIYKSSISYVKNEITKGDEVVLAFPDEDEFIMGIDHLHTFIHPVNRCVCFEWYLPPIEKFDNLDARAFFQLAVQKKLKGMLFTLWGDPFYKDYIIVLNEDTYEVLANAEVLAGYHRIVHDKKPLIYTTEGFHIVYHLKGMPFKIMKVKMSERVNMITDTDDWVAHHYTRQYNSLALGYNTFYKTLTSYEEINELLKAQIDTYTLEESFYEQTIVKQFIHSPGGSKPSMI